MYLGTIELDNFPKTPESITKTCGLSSYLSIDKAKTMNMNNMNLTKMMVRNLILKKTVFDKFRSGSIDSFNNYNEDYNNNYHSCEMHRNCRAQPHVSICFYHLDFLGLAKIIKFFH